MAKVSPIQTAFNGGEWSPLLEGRIDVQAYKTAVRQSFNCAGIVEGASMRRPGTEYRTRAYSNSVAPRLLAFEQDDTDGTLIEICAGRYRFQTDAGLTTRTATAVSGITIGGGSVLTVTSTSHGAAIGEQVVFSGFGTHAIDGATGTVTAVTTNTMTISAIRYVTTAPTLVGGETVARVYHTTNPFTADQLRSIQMAHSIDVGYLFADGPSPRVLQRYAATDWRDAALAFTDGPYLKTNNTTTTLTVTERGHAVDTHGGTTTAASTAGGSSTSYPFLTTDVASFWEAGTSGTGVYFRHDFGSGVTIDGFSIERPYASNGGSGYTYEQQSPLYWTLTGSNDLVTFTQLNIQRKYAAWVDERTQFFSIATPASYRYYTFVFTPHRDVSCPVAVGRILLREVGATATLTASSTTGINDDQGFLSTDVGRHIRVKDTDGYWRWGVIATRTSATEIDIDLRDAPFRANGSKLSEWRLGLYSDTTGYPRAACFFQDRLWMDGGPAAPDTLCGSVTGGYAASSVSMSPTAMDGEVLDTSGITATLNARKLSAIRWLAADDQGLVVGTGSSVWIVRAADQRSALTAANRDARQVVFRGIGNTDPLLIDNQIVCTNAGNTRLFELVYNDGLQRYAPSDLTTFASHLTAPGVTATEYAAEPHPIIWAVTSEGTLLGATYLKQMDVLGWHRHSVGTVDDIAVMRSADGTRDELWLCTKRTIGGQDERFIERMRPWQSYTDTETDAWYADCGLRYDGAAVTTISGLWHLEGRSVAICADGARHAAKTVTNGAITLDLDAEIVTVGLGYATRLETQRPDAGAADGGTSQGKMKRVNRVILRLWRSMAGNARRPDEADGFALEYQQPDDATDTALSLFSGDVQIDFQPGYDRAGTIIIEQAADVALPLNVIAYSPHLFTSDT